jgi:hypothetical protein
VAGGVVVPVVGVVGTAAGGCTVAPLAAAPVVAPGVAPVPARGRALGFDSSDAQALPSMNRGTNQRVVFLRFIPTPRGIVAG